MPSRLPNVTVLGLLGAVLTIIPSANLMLDAEEPPESEVATWLMPTSITNDGTQRAAAVLDRAIRLLERRRWISARVRQEVDLFGKKPVGSGVYLEDRSGPSPLLRLEMRLQVGARTSSLLQVADGRYLWMYEQLLDDEKLRRVDWIRVQNALEDMGKWPEAGSQGWCLKLVGINKVIEAVRGAFDFGQLESTRFHGVPAWRMVGRWKPERLAALLPDQSEAITAGQVVDFEALPSHLPDHVVLYLGQEDGFPYRIEYRRWKGAPDQPATSPTGKTIVGILFYEVNLDVPLPSGSFVYNPGDLEPMDDTRAFLNSLAARRSPP